jgi:hypothetical protein
MSPVQGAARGRHIRSRLERLNARIRLLHAFILVGHSLEGARVHVKGDDTSTLPLNFPFPTFRQARAALKQIPRNVRVAYESELRAERADAASQRMAREKAKIQSDTPAALHAARASRKEHQRSNRNKNQRKHDKSVPREQVPQAQITVEVKK